MGVEIERKYLVNMELLKEKLFEGDKIIQGYIPTSETEQKTVVRVRTKGDFGYLTIKGKTEGISRAEYEYSIPLTDAIEMLNKFCSADKIEKTRYEVVYGGFVWEIDVFEGENEGLVIAEIELESEEDKYPIPEWILEDVTTNNKYSNSNLIKNPYKNWEK